MTKKMRIIDKRVATEYLEYAKKNENQNQKSIEKDEQLESDFDDAVEGQKAEVVDLVKKSETLVADELVEVEVREQLKADLEDAKNVLLGSVSDDSEEFYTKQKEIIQKWEEANGSESYTSNEHQEKMAWNSVYNELADDNEIKALVDEKRKDWAKLDGVDDDYTNHEQFSLQTGEALKQVIEEKNKATATKRQEDMKNADDIVDMAAARLQPKIEVEELTERLKKEKKEASEEAEKESTPQKPELILVEDLDTSPEADLETAPISEKNKGRISSLTTEAKRVWADWQFKKSQRGEIKNAQEGVKVVADELYRLKVEKLKSEDKIAKFNDRLVSINEVLAKAGIDISTTVEKSKKIESIKNKQSKLKAEIKQAEIKQKKLEKVMAKKRELKERLEANIDEILETLKKEVADKLKPYEAESDKLEHFAKDLAEEKDDYGGLITKYEEKLTTLNDQIVNLSSVDMSFSQRRSLKAVLKSKVREIQAELRSARKNLAKTKANYDITTKRNKKERAKIDKWYGFISESREKSEKTSKIERSEVKRQYEPMERPVESLETQAIKEPTVNEYVKAWNRFSRSDGMSIDKNFLSKLKTDITIAELLKVIDRYDFKLNIKPDIKKKKIAEKKKFIKTFLELK